MTKIVAVALATVAIGCGYMGFVVTEHVVSLQDVTEAASGSLPEKVQSSQRRTEWLPEVQKEALFEMPLAVVPAKSETMWKAVGTIREPTLGAKSREEIPVGTWEIKPQRASASSSAERLAKTQTEPSPAGQTVDRAQDGASNRDGFAKPMGIGGPSVRNGDEENRPVTSSRPPGEAKSHTATAGAGPDSRARKTERVRQMIHTLFQDPSRN